LFDGRGLYLEIAPTGSRWWRFKYRFAGKEKRISLGVYPDVGLKKARDRRDEMRKFVADGIDPSAARKQEKLMALDAALNTFEAVAREWFEKHSPNWEASYSVKLLARLEANVFPWLGHRPIRDIKAPELLSVLRRVESRGVLETAHRLMNYCGNIYRYAVGFAECAGSPDEIVCCVLARCRTARHVRRRPCAAIASAAVHRSARLFPASAGTNAAVPARRAALSRIP
jgi:integrase